VIRLGLEPKTPTLKVLSLKTFKSLAYGSTFKGNLLSKRILQLSFYIYEKSAFFFGLHIGLHQLM